MSDEVYKRLREFLHNLPGGYPETESGETPRIHGGEGADLSDQGGRGRLSHPPPTSARCG